MSVKNAAFHPPVHRPKLISLKLFMQAYILVSIVIVSTVIELRNRFNSRRGRRRPAVRLAEAIESPLCNVIYLLDLKSIFD